MVRFENDFTGLYLLSKEEADQIPEEKLAVSQNWWLRTPGILNHLESYVRSNGNINTAGINIEAPTVYLRPALNLEPEIIESLTGGDGRILLGEYEGETLEWIRIAEGTILAKDTMGSPVRFSIGSNYYDFSEVKKRLEEISETLPDPVKAKTVQAPMQQEEEIPERKSDSPLRKNREEICSNLITLMQDKDLSWIRGWFQSARANRPYNPVSGAVYKGGNWIRLELTGRADPRWMTYKQAESQGYQVKKGEKAIRLEKWLFTKEMEEEDPETGLKEKVIKILDPPVCKMFCVFNAEQIEGIPPLDIPQEPERFASGAEWIRELISDYIASSECPVVISPSGNCAYNPSLDQISIPPVDDFYTLEECFGSLTHEMAHSTGHSSRLNRELSTEFGSVSYAREEIRAELSSVFLSADMHVDPDFGEHFQNHAAYLKNWLSTLKDDPNELFRVLSDCEKIVSRLEKNYTNYLQTKPLSVETEETKETNYEEEKPLESKKTEENPAEIEAELRNVGKGIRR